MKILKTSLAGFLLLIIMLSSCEENITEPEVTANNKTDENLTFTFTDEEVDELMMSKFGRSLNTFEQKADFLLDHIHTNLMIPQRIDDGGGFPTGLRRVECVAGIYDQISGSWNVVTKQGYTNEFVHASKTIRSGDRITVGALAAVYIDDDNNGYFAGWEVVEREYIAPTFLNCTNGDEGTYGNAKALRLSDGTGGTVDAYALVKCDD